MRTKRHMSVNIEGMLRHYKGKKITFCEDDQGRPMTDQQARIWIAECQSKGWKLLPTADCEGFDPFGKGCPGHPITEDQEKDQDQSPPEQTPSPVS